MSTNPTITIKGRTIYKHMTEAEWMANNNQSYIPAASEKVIYDADDKHPCARIKIGDGINQVCNLPFVIDTTVSNWAREAAVPSGVYRGSTNPDELVDENGASLKGKYDIWFDPSGEPYCYELSPEEMQDIIDQVTSKVSYYCHHIQLGFRDPTINIDAGKDDDSKGMFNIAFDIINSDSTNYSFEFNRLNPSGGGTGGGKSYATMNKETAQKLLKLYRELQISTTPRSENNLETRPASGSVYKAGGIYPISTIGANYELYSGSDVTASGGSIYVRVICVQGCHLGQDSNKNYHLNPITYTINCGLSVFVGTEEQALSLDEEFNKLNTNDKIQTFYCKETIVCKDTVESLSFQVIQN